MLIDSNSMISITEVNQNFSKAAKRVDDSGKLIILKNNKPAYVLSRFQDDELHFMSNQEILELGSDILDEFKDDFLKMAE